MNKVISNFHTHTTFCDGKDLPEKMILEAIAKGIKHLGFSAHAIYPLAANWHMQVEKYKDYKNEIENLKTKYKDQIELFCGLEADFFPPVSYPDHYFYSFFEPDYIIGSVHFVQNNDNQIQKPFTVDGPIEEVKEGLKLCFNNNGRKYVENYYERVRNMVKTCDCDIIGHLDLIKKLNSKLNIFNENDNWYKKEIKATSKEIAKANIIVEINTGGMARQYTTTPYPSLAFLQELKKHDVPITISSDSHNISTIDFGFNTALSLALEAGYTEYVYLTNDGWKTEQI